MSYFRFPAELAHCPPMMMLSDRASYVFMEGLAYCARNLTDGHLSWSALRELKRFTPKAGAELLRLGGWELRSQRDPMVKRRLVAKLGDACAYCTAPGPGLHVEHIIPLCRGGADEWDNLTLACQRCNYSKARKTAAEFGFPQFTGRLRSGPGASASLSVLSQGLLDGWERRGDVAPRARRVHFPDLPVLAGEEFASRHWPLVEFSRRASRHDGQVVAGDRPMLPN